MSIARHFRLCIYAVLVAVLALIAPLILALLGYVLIAPFNCTDNGPGFTCQLSQLNALVNVIGDLIIVLYGLSIVTGYLAGLSVLLLLMSLFFRLSILLVMHVIIRVGR